MELNNIIFLIAWAWAGNAFETNSFRRLFLGNLQFNIEQRNVFDSTIWKHIVYIEEKRNPTKKELSFCSLIRY
jgi:hypothetical protein